jgi:hypothetical protein
MKLGALGGLGAAACFVAGCAFPVATVKTDLAAEAATHMP